MYRNNLDSALSPAVCRFLYIWKFGRELMWRFSSYERTPILFYVQNHKMHFCFTTSEMTKYCPLENPSLCTCYFQSLPQSNRLSFRCEWIETILKFSSSSPLYLCVRLSASFSLLSHSLFLTLKFHLKIFVVLPLGKPYITSEASTECLGESSLLCWDSFITRCSSCQGMVSNTTHLPFSHSFINTNSCDSIKSLGTYLFLYKDLSTSWKHTEVDTWHGCSHGSWAAGVAFG